MTDSPDKKCDGSMTCDCRVCKLERERAVAQGVRGNPSDPLPRKNRDQGLNPRTGA